MTEQICGMKLHDHHMTTTMTSHHVPILMTLMNTIKASHMTFLKIYAGIWFRFLKKSVIKAACCYMILKDTTNGYLPHCLLVLGGVWGSDRNVQGK